MANPAKRYQREMHSRLGFYANWLPGDHLEIGAVGVLSDSRFHRQTSLQELGIEFTEGPAGQRQDLRYTSSAGVAIAMTADASAAAIGQAGLSITFSEEGSFLFHALGLRQRELQERGRVAKAVIDLHHERKWKRNWVLVTGVHVADSATIIVSETQGAGVTLDASGAGPLSSDVLADASAGLRVTGSVGRLLIILCESRLRPLYTCVGLSGGWLPGDSPSVKARAHPIETWPIEALLNS